MGSSRHCSTSVARIHIDAATLGFDLEDGCSGGCRACLLAVADIETKSSLRRSRRTLPDHRAFTRWPNASVETTVGPPGDVCRLRWNWSDSSLGHGIGPAARYV